MALHRKYRLCWLYRKKQYSLLIQAVFFTDSECILYRYRLYFLKKQAAFFTDTCMLYRYLLRKCSIAISPFCMEILIHYLRDT